MTTFSARHGERKGAAAGIEDQALCLQIQVDLSAMLVGELDPASIRRVFDHSDLCPGASGDVRASGFGE